MGPSVVDGLASDAPRVSSNFYSWMVGAGSRSSPCWAIIDCSAKERTSALCKPGLKEFVIMPPHLFYNWIQVFIQFIIGWTGYYGGVRKRRVWVCSPAPTSKISFYFPTKNPVQGRSMKTQPGSTARTPGVNSRNYWVSVIKHQTKPPLEDINIDYEWDRP